MDTRRIMLALSLVGMMTTIASGQSQGGRLGWRTVAARTDSAAKVRVQVQPSDTQSRSVSQSSTDDRDDGSKDDGDSENRRDLTGSWLGSVSYSGEAPFQAFSTFGKDGTFVGSAQGDVLLAEGVVFSSQHGAWTDKGRKKFALKMLILFYDSNTELIVTLRLRFRIKLLSRNTWRATFAQDEILPDGTVVNDILSGTAEARRIRVN